MKKSEIKKSTKVISLICIIAILLTLSCQFMASWSFSGVIENEDTGERYAKDDLEMSLASYVWFPYEQESKAFEDYLKDPSLRYSQIVTPETFDKDVLAAKTLKLYNEDLYEEKIADLEAAKEDLIDARADLVEAEEKLAEASAVTESTEDTKKDIEKAEEKVTKAKEDIAEAEADIVKYAEEAKAAAAAAGIEAEIVTEVPEATEEAEGTEEAETNLLAPVASEEAADDDVDEEFYNTFNNLISETAVAVGSEGKLVGEGSEDEYSYYVSMVEVTKTHKDPTDKAYYDTVLSNATDKDAKLEKYQEFSKKLDAEYSKYINDVSSTPVLLLILAVISLIVIVLALKKGVSHYVASILTIVFGALNLIYYAFTPIFILSLQNSHNNKITICVVTILLGLFFLYKDIKATLKNKTVSE